MPYYDVINLVTVTKMNMIDGTPGGHRTLRNHFCEHPAPSFPQTCAKDSAAPKIDYPISQIL
jgi:hypothetical protein